MDLDPTQLDALEAAAWKDLCQALPAPARERWGLEVLHVGPAVVLRSTGVDHLLLNRAIGLEGEAPAPKVDAVLEAFRERSIDRFFVHVHDEDADGALGRALEDRGLSRYRRRWAKYVRGIEPLPEGSTDLTVVPARAEHAGALGRIYGDAFDMPDAGPELVAAVVGRPRWHVFAALDGDEPVALGALYADGPVGSLTFAATRPSHRGRGAQSALIARRIRAARELGCRHVAAETGEEMPGEPNPSGDNLLRHGFRIAGMRVNYTLPGTGWARRNDHGG